MKKQEKLKPKKKSEKAEVQNVPQHISRHGKVIETAMLKHPKGETR